MVDKSSLTAFAKFVDFTGRMTVAYGIYQFVSAFRRHGRK